ncbi:MAG: hypothetical protein DRP66_03790 [Planctomycetota bacterium]|nr:MAG: hypothetical protein DRP66_03790 [Planctomycetota bacterium]
MLELEPQIEHVEGAPGKRLTWLVDSFLYPISAAGLTMLGMFVLLPFVLKLILQGLVWLGIPAIIVPAAFIFLIIRCIIMFYMFWYLGFCIRESAEGHFRAPDTLAPDSDDGIGETIRQTLMILGTAAVCLLPGIVYYLTKDTIDINFWLLLAAGGFFLPMAMLSVVMQDGLWGLNPFGIVVSIIRTFLKYCCVTGMFYVPIAIIAYVMIYVPKDNVVMKLLFRAMYVYLLIVASHMLGRFFYNNEGRLDWF